MLAEHEPLSTRRRKGMFTRSRGDAEKKRKEKKRRVHAETRRRGEEKRRKEKACSRGAAETRKRKGKKMHVHAERPLLAGSSFLGSRASRPHLQGVRSDACGIDPIGHIGRISPIPHSLADA